MVDWDRIAKIVRMLASNKPGEVLGTIDALVRVLASDGLTINDIADRLLSVDTLQVALNNACRDIEQLRAEVESVRQTAMQPLYYNVYDTEQTQTSTPPFAQRTVVDESSTGQSVSNTSWFETILPRGVRK